MARPADPSRRRLASPLRLAAAVLVLATAEGVHAAPERDFLEREVLRESRGVFPGAKWEARAPADLGMSAASLQGIRDVLGGRGAIVRSGYLIYTWGDASGRADVASAGKPLYTHFLLAAVEDGRLATVDALVTSKAPCLGSLNPSLGHKDRAITFRHMATQVSCYGVTEAPGRAFDYNDWQMALFWDTLFLGVWGTTYSNVDAEVLVPELSSILRFEDAPTFLAFGAGDRPGRVAISPRDFCRFGLLYLRRGKWNGERVLGQERALTAVTRPLPLELPRTAAVEADLCAGQRTLGSTSLPDDQYDHDGGYSWGWWANGVTRGGGRRWPAAGADVYAAIGHDGSRGLAVVPGLDVVLSWNDGTPDVLNEVFRKLYEAASVSPAAPPVEVGAALRVDRDGVGTWRVDWSADHGGPRWPGEHYLLLRGTHPTTLDVVSATDALSATESAATAGRHRLVFYRVVAAPRGELADEDDGYADEPLDEDGRGYVVEPADDY